jgi:hypothetical protein
MTTTRPMNPSEPSAERRELARIVRQIQAVALELQEELERREPDAPAVNVKERRLDQLRWQLAGVARRTATEGLGNAA